MPVSVRQSKTARSNAAHPVMTIAAKKAYQISLKTGRYTTAARIARRAGLGEESIKKAAGLAYEAVIKRAIEEGGLDRYHEVGLYNGYFIKAARIAKTFGLGEKRVKGALVAAYNASIYCKDEKEAERILRNYDIAVDVYQSYIESSNYDPAEKFGKRYHLSEEEMRTAQRNAYQELMERGQSHSAARVAKRFGLGAEQKKAA